MKVDLGDYKYCETDELEEIGKIKNKSIELSCKYVKVNGTLFKTPLDNYVFFGRVYDVGSSADCSSGWKIIKKEELRNYLKCCDTVNESNKWDILGYEKV